MSTLTEGGFVANMGQQVYLEIAQEQNLAIVLAEPIERVGDFLTILGTVERGERSGRRRRGRTTGS